MKWTLLLFAVADICSGGTYDYNGLRAKFGLLGFLEDRRYFFNMPLNVTAATKAGYVLRARPSNSPLPTLTMYCLSGDVYVCPLFAPSGNTVGLQIAVPTDWMEKVPADLTTKFIKWSDVTVGTNTANYWTTVLLLVPKDSLSDSTKPLWNDVGSSIYATAPTDVGGLREIPLNEAALASKTLYTEQRCVMNMGTHYWYNMSAAMSCDQFYPWFLLVKEGKVIGAGMQTYGTRKTVIGTRDWFEYPDVIAAEYIIPRRPSCLEKWVKLYGLITIHFYFVQQPWKISCQKGDSVESSPVADTLLSGVNAASKLNDKIVKHLSG